MPTALSHSILNALDFDWLFKLSARQDEVSLLTPTCFLPPIAVTFSWESSVSFCAVINRLLVIEV